MSFRFLFAPNEQELERAADRARRAVVAAFQWAVYNRVDCFDAAETLRQILTATPDRDVERWATQVADDLVRTIQQLQTAATWEAARAEGLQRELDAHRRAASQREAHPLQERVQSLARSRDQWQEKAGGLAVRVDSLEQALDAARQASRFQQAEIARLEEQVAALNRIVVRQQETLNAGG